MEEVGFVLPAVIAWTLRSRLLPEWNDFDWRNLFMACLDRLAMAEVDFGMTRLVSTTLC
jgi:hypothetical protein